MGGVVVKSGLRGGVRFIRYDEFSNSGDTAFFFCFFLIGIGIDSKHDTHFRSVGE